MVEGLTQQKLSFPQNGLERCSIESSIASRGVSAVIFDLESTLSALEAHIQWGAMRGNREALDRITNTVMGNGRTFTATHERLGFTEPDVEMTAAVAARYPQYLVKGACKIIQALRYAGIDVFMVSGGFKETMEPVRQALGIDEDHFFANSIYHDAHGKFGGWRDGEILAQEGGKRMLAAELIRSGKLKEPFAVVGDGITDMNIHAQLRIGFGGLVARTEVKEKADVFVYDLCAVVPLLVGTRRWHEFLSPQAPSNTKKWFGEALINLFGFNFEQRKTHFADSNYEMSMRSAVMQLTSSSWNSPSDVSYTIAA